MLTPTSFDGLFDAWQSGNSAVRDLMAGLSQDQLQLPTGCTAWRVQDVFAHIIDIECLMAGDLPMQHQPDWDSLAPLGRSGRVTEIGVDARRGRSLAALLVEFDEINARRTDQFNKGPHDLTSLVKGPTGTDWPLQRALEMRINDTWVHEQDIRAAIGIPGNLDTEGALISARSLLDMLPFAWAKNVQAPPLTSIEIRITSPFEMSGQAITDTEGRASVTTGATPDVMILGPWAALLPLLAGRSKSADLTSQLDVTGNPELATRFLAGMDVTP